MKILYFSSTGNSLYVAKRIGGECISISHAEKEKIYTFEDDVIGVVFPVYWLSVPAIVREFLSKVTFQCDYLFGVVTYGDNMYGAMDDLNHIIFANKREFDYINAVKMVENYLPIYEMEKEIKKAESFDTDIMIDQIYNDIKNQVKHMPKISWFSKKLTGMFRKKHCMSIGAGEAADFAVSQDCVLCGQCARICPMDNITISDSEVVFGEQCADCLGCIQNCPKAAIHTEKEKSTARYRNPNIKISELE